VRTTPDEDGIFSSVALNLPGTGSCGPTENDAIERFKEAAAGMIESYLEADEAIPWKRFDPWEIPHGAKWILVNV
jgi:predicted RNase H-like HicB family nuclease